MEDNYSLSLFVLSLALSKMTLRLAINGKSAERNAARVRSRASARKHGLLARGEGHRDSRSIKTGEKLSMNI